MMEMAIKVIVRVNDEHHANRIRKDILEAVKGRTTIYYIGEPESTSQTIADMSGTRHYGG
jgi:hypothetical protein